MAWSRQSTMRGHSYNGHAAGPEPRTTTRGHMSLCLCNNFSSCSLLYSSRVLIRVIKYWSWCNVNLTCIRGIYRLVRKRRHSIVNAMEWRLFRTNPDKRKFLYLHDLQNVNPSKTQIFLANLSLFMVKQVPKEAICWRSQGRISTLTLRKEINTCTLPGKPRILVTDSEDISMGDCKNRHLCGEVPSRSLH